MRVIVLGGDGYLGWPTAMHFSASGHEVWAVDNYLRRRLAQETNSEALFPNPNLNERARIFAAASGHEVNVVIGDCTDYRMMSRLFADVQPDAVIHYAEQPSGPFSMIGYDQAKATFDNNLSATFNVIWAVMENALGMSLARSRNLSRWAGVMSRNRSRRLCRRSAGIL